MGQHTWFVKSREKYVEMIELYDKLYQHETGEIWLSDEDITEIEVEIDKVNYENRTKYHDLFRTSKRNPDKTYIDEVITSKEESFKWIENPDNKVYFSYTITDSEEKIQENKDYCYKQLNKFWEEYPDGLIYFG